MDTQTDPYAGYHYPTVIISHAVRLYFRFTLSLRDVEELLTSRGVIVTDKLKSDGADTRDILPGVEHRQHKGLNNRPKCHINQIDKRNGRCEAAGPRLTLVSRFTPHGSTSSPSRAKSSDISRFLGAGRVRRRWSPIVRRSRTVYVGQAPSPHDS